MPAQGDELLTNNEFLTRISPSELLIDAGLKFGDRGTHTSRTMMLSEISDLLSSVPQGASRADYSAAIIQDNVLGKRTASNKRLTNQRLGELYGLDSALPLFRVFHRLWTIDPPGRPILALLVVLGRDPLFRMTASVILGLEPGEELMRSRLIAALREGTGERFNEAILDKVARNAASSWTQSGHLSGRIRKVRRAVEKVTPGALVLGLWMGSLFGRTGGELLTSPWMRVFDRSSAELIEAVLYARRLHLLTAHIAGDVMEISLDGLDSGGLSDEQN